MPEAKDSSKFIGQHKWEIGECRCEDGIFFGDGRALLFSGDLGKRQFTRTDIKAMMATAPDSWTAIYPIEECVSHEHGISVCVGGGSWEGEGFLAVCHLSDDSLIWLIHLSDSEQFTELQILGDEIVAISEVYPIRNEWVVPIHNPEGLRKVA